MMVYWFSREKNQKQNEYLRGCTGRCTTNTLLPNEEVGFNKDGTTLLHEMFGEKMFDQPKPVTLIKYLLSIKNKKHDYNNWIILDFMAGSGTTGHAVLELNKEDGGNRQFILCTNNENNICTDVCYPRVQKVIKGYKNSKAEKIDGLGGNLKYFKTAFVGSEPTHRNKKMLTDKSVEMLCIKENTFEEVLNKRQLPHLSSKTRRNIWQSS